MAILEDYDAYLEDLNELDDDEQQQQQNSNNNCVYIVDESLTLSNFHVKKFKDITSKVENLFSLGLELTVDSDPDAQYRFTVASNNLLLEIDSQIFNLYNLIRDKYCKKFPELESVIQDPIEYARVVKKIGNETDISVIDGLNLAPAILMVVSITITASTTSGKPLSEQDLADTIHACDYVLALDSSKKRVLDLLEARMGYIAPNLSAIVGVTVAAKLIVAVGGLSSLAYTPCNVKLVGAVKNANIGLSNVKTCLLGYLEETEIYRSMRPSLKRCIGGVLPNKAVLAARMDLTKGDPTGKWGRDTLDTIRETIEKLQEPPPARLAKPLPAPVLDYSSKKKKRGAQRQRNSKKRYGITETRKLANRVQFGVPEESYLGAGYGKGYGILGQAGLKVQR